ncbi:MAG: VTT domain-containing protein [Syntrophobacteraceae bacterium]
MSFCPSDGFCRDRYGAVFGPYLGFACVCPGALAGAVISYLTARRVGRDFVYPLIGDRLKNYDGLIEHNGFQAVLFLRLRKHNPSAFPEGDWV